MVGSFLLGVGYDRTRVQVVAVVHGLKQASGNCMVVWTGFGWGVLSWQQHQSVQIAILLLIDDFNCILYVLVYYVVELRFC